MGNYSKEEDKGFMVDTGNTKVDISESIVKTLRTSLRLLLVCSLRLSSTCSLRLSSTCSLDGIGRVDKKLKLK